MVIVFRLCDIKVSSLRGFLPACAAEWRYGNPQEILNGVGIKATHLHKFMGIATAGQEPRPVCQQAGSQ